MTLATDKPLCVDGTHAHWWIIAPVEPGTFQMALHGTCRRCEQEYTFYIMAAVDKLRAWKQTRHGHAKPHTG